MAIFLFSISILSLVWYTWLLVKKRRYPLPPGPQGLPIVGYLPFLQPQLHSHFAQLANKHGAIFSLKLGGKTSVVISSAAVARVVLKESDVTFANREVPDVVTALEYGGHDIVFTPYGAEWRMLRKVCVRDMLCNATLDAFYSYRRNEVRNCVSHLFGLKGAPVNVGELMFSSVLNVITSMLWGGTIQGNGKAGTGSEFRQVVGEITDLLGQPNVSDFFPWLAWMDLQGMKKKMGKVKGKLEHIFEKMIEQGMEMEMEATNGGNLGRATNFLQVLLRLREGGATTQPPFTMQHVKALLMDVVVGGTDTSSNTVEFAIAEMMNNPQVMLKAQQELDNVVGRNRTVEESDVKNLPYLNAVMKEVLRLHPALPSWCLIAQARSLSLQVSGESMHIWGYTIPKGTRVFVNVWAIHRDPERWTNATEFIPERFLDGKEDYSGNDFSYIPFGSGRIICAGIAMAERLVMYSLASLVHSFDWKMPDGEKLEISEKFGIVLKKRLPLVAIPIPRLSDAQVYE